MANNEQTIEGRLLLWVTDWLTTALLSAGMVFPCLSAYGISGQYGFDLGEVLACCVFGSLAATLIFTWRHGYWAALAALAMGSLVFWRLWAHMEKDWRRSRPPELADLLDASPGALFLLYALVILTLGWVVVRVRVWWLAAALVVLPVVPAIGAGVLPSWAAMLSGFAGWGSMLLTDLFNKKDKGSLARARLLSLTGMAALILILVIALPREGYLRPQWATDARNNMIRSVNRQLSRFFSQDELENNLLSQLGLDLTIEGETLGGAPGYGWGSGTTEVSGTGMDRKEDLLHVGPRHYAERLLLRVDTDQPNPAGRMYLRGASYSTYTGTSWESGSGTEEIHPEYFPPLTAPNTPSYTMRVRDAGFSGTWYYPYRYDGSGQLDPDGRLTLEWNMDFTENPDLITSWNDLPTEEYYVSYRPGGPEDGFIPLDGVWEAEESVYRFGGVHYSDGAEADNTAAVHDPIDGVYAACLDVPSGLRGTLEPLLEEVRSQQAAADERLPEQFREPVACAARTAAWLASAAVYDPGTPAMETGEDFVAHFLEEGRGFCVHFATAGTMLLRMQGIPARYVNGYVATLDSRGWGTVLDSDAHAWVEIYLDGYGWYPVDMTPGYAGGISGAGLEGAAGEPEADAPGEDPEEELPDEDEESPGEETPEEEKPDGQVPEEEELPGEEEAEETGFAIPWKVLFGFAVFWAALCAAYLLALLARSQSRKDRDTNRSVLNAYGRYKRLRRWGCGEDGELERLAKKAKFSQHTLTEEERETAWKCLDGNMKESRVGQPLRRRWLLTVLTPLF